MLYFTVCIASIKNMHVWLRIVYVVILVEIKNLKFKVKAMAN